MSNAFTAQMKKWAPGKTRDLPETIMAAVRQVIIKIRTEQATPSRQ